MEIRYMVKMLVNEPLTHIYDNALRFFVCFHDFRVEEASARGIRAVHVEDRVVVEMRWTGSGGTEIMVEGESVDKATYWMSTLARALGIEKGDE